MTSFSLPGRRGSILNDDDAGPSSHSRNSAVGSPREQIAQHQQQQHALTEGAAEAVGASKRGPVSRSWRKNTAAASVADAAIGAGATESQQAAPAIVVPSEGSGPGSADTTPPSTGSGSEDSTGSYFKSMHHAGHRAGKSTLRSDSFSYSTSATSIEPSDSGSQGVGKLRVPRATQDRRSLQGEKVLSEPGLDSSPRPIGSSPAVASPAPPTLHNGPGGHGSTLDSHGLTAPAAEQAARRPSLQRKSARSGKLERDVASVSAVKLNTSTPEPSISNSSSAAPSSSSTSITPTDAPSTSRTSSQPLTIGGKKRYPCPHPGCDKTFSTSGHAARHHRIHSGRKPYRCTFPGCKASFSRQDNSLQHYRTHVLHPKGRSNAATASLDDDGGNDLNMFQLDAETEASVQLGRKALQEGTAIAIVQEVVTRDGKREEAVQRTVGMPRLRRDSTWSEQPLDTDMNEELAFDGPSTRVRSISGSESLGAYSPPAADYAVNRAAPKRLSMPQLPQLAAPLPYAPSTVHVQHAFSPPMPRSLPPAMSPASSFSNHRFAPYAVPPHSTSPVLSGQASRVSTATGLSSMSGLIGGNGRMDVIVSAAPADSRWSESPLDLLPSHWRGGGGGSRDGTSSAPPGCAEAHIRRCSFSAARDAIGTGAEAEAANSRARDHSVGKSAAMCAVSLGHSTSTPTSLGTAYVPLAAAAVTSSLLPSPQSSLKAPLVARASMHLGGLLPSLTQLPCSSDRSTSCLTPTTPFDSPGFASSLTPAARRDPLHLPPLRPQQERR